jgi:hypothetical protein
MGLVRFVSSEDLSCAEMDQELTQAGIVIGTVAYMSPEQALDTRSADQRSDVYSLGCTLFFLLTGRSLYHEETGMKTLLAHREQSVPSIRQFREDVPVSLDSVFRTMVAKRPGDRMQSMSEVIAAIDECRAQLPTATPAENGFSGFSPAGRPRSVPAPKWQSRFFPNRLVVGALAASVGLIVLAAVIIIRVTIENGKTGVTIETDADRPAPGTKKELGGLDRLELESHGIPAARIAGGTDLVEVPLGRFSARKDSNDQWMNLDLVATVQSKDFARMKADKDTHQVRITGAVRDAVRATSRDDLDDPQLTRFKANLKSQINAELPEPYVHQILVQNWIPSGRAHGSGDKGPAAPGKPNELIEYNLGVFTVPLEGGAEVHTAFLAVINPADVNALQPLIDDTHAGRVREAVASVMHSLTNEDAQDLEHKHMKELLIKAINNVLPEPYIHQIIVAEFRITAQSAAEEGNAGKKDQEANRPKSSTSASPSSTGATQVKAATQSKAPTNTPAVGNKTGR